MSFKAYFKIVNFFINNSILNTDKVRRYYNFASIGTSVLSLCNSNSCKSPRLQTYPPLRLTLLSEASFKVIYIYCTQGIYRGPNKKRYVYRYTYSCELWANHAGEKTVSSEILVICICVFQLNVNDI